MTKRRPVDWTRVGTWISRALTHGAVLIVPLILVNGFAVYGQGLWALDNLTDRWEVAALFAVALESIGLFLAAEAHRALMAGDAALRLRLASYGAAMIVGGLNYSHWAPDWTANPKAVTFAALSAVSPWLWSIRSRSMHRAELRIKGLIDPRTVRFSMARWVLYPWPTFVAFRRAVWVGETDPSKAAALGPVRNVMQATPETRGVPAATAPTTTQTVEPTTAAASTSTPAPEPQPAGHQEPTAPDRQGRAKNPSRDRAAAVAALLDAHPGMTQPDVARHLNASVRTIQRAWPKDISPLVSVRERTGS